MPTATPQLHWIRPPRQARTQEVMERLLDAALALLAEKGFEDMSVSEVARRAETSVGALYRRFSDKVGLLHALHDRFCVEAHATADAALDSERWGGANIPEIVSAVIGFLIQVYVDHAPLERAVFQRSITDERFRERSVRLNRRVLEGMSELLLARRDEIQHPEPELAVGVALRQALGFLNDYYIIGSEGYALVPLSDAQVNRELTRSCLAYLGVPTSGTAA